MKNNYPKYIKVIWSIEASPIDEFKIRNTLVKNENDIYVVNKILHYMMEKHMVEETKNNFYRRYIVVDDLLRKYFKSVLTLEEQIIMNKYFDLEDSKIHRISVLEGFREETLFFS
jgi:hypothetical protein